MGYSMNNLAQVTPTFENLRDEEGAISAGCQAVMPNRELLRPPSTEPLTWGDVELADWGFWLLRGATSRQGGWESLRESSRGSVEPGRINVRSGQEIMKRCFDIVGAFVLLTVLLPLLAFVALLIKLDSRGSVLFCHERVGKDDTLFTLWKFRSMRMEVPKYEVSPISVADTRLTRVGRWMRRMSIDEMPQLINVLKGEMSLVGPRPEMPFIVERYGPEAYERLSVKPGITGLWQISPARAHPIHENLQYDLHYIRNQNLLLDCAIIVRTIAAVIHGVGAV
jgi:lipopolysaccharide/colanic/teichoic acid biosynthesis glycosyltransferase